MISPFDLIFISIFFLTANIQHVLYDILYLHIILYNRGNIV